MSLNLEIESSDVIRLILQFMKENNLQRSLQTLQEESRVTLDAVENVEQFLSEIQHGRWDTVVQTVGTLTLPEDLVHFLYEQIIHEMLELQEFELARSLLRETAALQSLKLSDPERYKRLQQLCSRSYCDAKDLYENSSKEKRRAKLAQGMVECIGTAPPSRLIALIGMALKWQQHQGITPPGEKFDLFRNVAAKGKEQPELCPQHISKAIRFGKKSHPECALFSPDGQYLVSGSADGFVEVWNWMNGTLNKDLEYQKNDDLMMHEDAVTAITFSRDSEVLATGSHSGNIKVWRIAIGLCVRKFDNCHEEGITSICFSRDSLMLLTASFDHTARIHGLKSGKTLKLFRGHSSYVNSAIFTADGNRVITASSDGRIKIWDAKTTECIQSFSPPPPPYMNSSTALSVNCVFHASMTNHIFVCTKSPTIYLMNLTGQVIKTFSSGKREGGDFVAACASPRGEWVYCIGEDSTLYCFANSTGKLEHVMKIHDKDAIGLHHHPHHNLVATWGFDGVLNLLKP